MLLKSFGGVFSVILKNRGFFSVGLGVFHNKVRTPRKSVGLMDAVNGIS